MTVTISNANADDFAANVVSLRAELKLSAEGRPTVVVWKIPARLAMKTEIMSAIVNELMAEVRDQMSAF